MTLGYSAKKFSEKVRAMNDSNSIGMSMTTAEARNLHTDIFALLAKIAELSEQTVVLAPTVVEIDGKSF